MRLSRRGEEEEEELQTGPFLNPFFPVSFLE